MQVVETFGRYVENLSETNPSRARKLLKTGWHAQNLKNRLAPMKELLPADQYLARLMMDTMLKPLEDPDHSVLVSVFTPCELMQEMGLYPYNVEAFSCYLSASKADRGFLQAAEDSGISETLCSYHKTFIGAAQKGLLPRPRCIVYTSLACDANLLTFRELAALYDVPCFAIDVPAGRDEANVAYVADQLRDLAAFLEKHTGRKLDEAALRERLGRSRRTLLAYDRFQKERVDKYVPADLVSPLYSGMTNNILLGTKEEEDYVNRLLIDLKKAGPSRGKRIYWMHTIPFWSQAVKDVFFLKESAQIVGCELAQVADLEHLTASSMAQTNSGSQGAKTERFMEVGGSACDNPACGSSERDGQFASESTADCGVSDDPYMDMAMRLVYNSLNGSITRRIDAGIRHAKETRADGVVWFNHWGCKHTLGGSGIARKKFAEAGIPLLILDGDACDRSHGGEGQTATRLGAFLEMLNE